MKIITDTGSDILEIEAKAMGVELVPISANFEDVIFDRNTEENFKAFYEKLRSEEQLPVSSQPSPAAFLEKYEAAEEAGEEVLVILISSKLSGTYNGAVLAKEMCGYEKIYIVDSLQASLSLRLLVEYAVKLKEEGKSAEEIAGILEEVKNRTYLTGVPSTLLYLKKGGRISPVVAAVGNVMGIKPVLLLRNGEIEGYSKARGMKAAKSGMQAFLKKGEVDNCMPVEFAHSNNPEMGEEFQKETMEAFSLTESSLHEVGMAIGTHIGPDALLMAFILKESMK